MQCEWNLFCSKKTRRERKIIEAGTRDSQKIVAEGLNNDIIKLRSIEAFLNYLNQVTKIIITDGKTPS
jgi:hypothetical protein